MKAHRSIRVFTAALASLAVVGAALVPCRAYADDTIRHPGEHSIYMVEIEPHLELAYGDWTAGVLGGTGYGAGARFTFPIVKNGFVPSINNTAAIGVGIDFLHFPCGFDGYNCSLNSLSFPVVLQWNFYVTKQWSVFGEPGLFLYHQFFDYSNVGCTGLGCPSVTTTSLLPAFWVGARYHINDRLSVTMRVGYPTLAVGMSFFD